MSEVFLARLGDEYLIASNVEPRFCFSATSREEALRKARDAFASYERFFKARKPVVAEVLEWERVELNGSLEPSSTVTEGER